uniref:Uncharacterized protein n=1 Tax=uncultured bacterium 4C6 TaxID=1701323 RepID=A0A0N9HU12_9BACT|nr:hypothetical protein [uncultured bacterium 4C6]
MKKTTLILLAALAFVQAIAQKLPNVQKASVRAPQSIKIDGKATEWQNKYQAYNNATDINYTLANDDKNLYLVIKAARSMVIQGKILSGGISFTVNHTLNKKDANAITVTYPVINHKDKDWRLVGDVFNSTAFANIEGNSNRDHTPSLTNLNTAFTKASKYIGVKGIKNVADNEIPVYNDLNIHAVATFHEPVVYVYELAIPLKLLALPAGDTKAFSYHIKLNVSKSFSDQFRAGAVPASGGNLGLEAPPQPDPVYLSSTDFWGEYTLAK